MRSPTLAILLLLSAAASADVTAPGRPPQPGPPAGADEGAPPDVARPPPEATCTASGLCTRVLLPGSGTSRPGKRDKVLVHYEGWATDGRRFDSSLQRGAPATFPLDGVIPGFREGVQLMVTGEQRRLWIPEALAYKGAPGKPAGMLVFDVELISIKPRQEIPAPPDVAAPGPAAKKTASGLRWLPLQRGAGKVHPAAADRVKVHYTGWTTDGKMFDSSVLRGEPATFPLPAVIPGWTEGVQLMVVGDKTRFWIPAELAYKNSPGRPQGTLVFDVELLDIIPAD